MRTTTKQKSMKTINRCTISIATTNGSGSQSANFILLKSLFRMGVPVSGKNIFPSNIAGLPTWFSIRVNEKGFVSYRKKNDIVIAMNPSTFQKDLDSLLDGGTFIYNSDLKTDPRGTNSNANFIAVSFRTLATSITDSPQLKKRLTNIIYVGILCALLDIPQEIVFEVIKQMFSQKSEDVIETNLKAFLAGYSYAVENSGEFNLNHRILKPAAASETNRPTNTPINTSTTNASATNVSVKADRHRRDQEQGSSSTPNQILIDGNTAAALGLMCGGCTVLSWYPITPSSSLAEDFERFCNQHRKDSKEKNNFAVIQAEDELSALSMALGASWAGARAATTTSGPGLSLMAESAGLSYFAEVPCALWNIQRAGPSTGLPTRTMQGDLLSSYHLSHGDTEHIVLLPGSPQECFEFGQTSLDLAEQFQTLVIVLSDLDLGMNMWTAEEFNYPTKKFERGKVLKEDDLKKRTRFFTLQRRRRRRDSLPNFTGD